MDILIKKSKYYFRNGKEIMNVINNNRLDELSYVLLNYERPSEFFEILNSEGTIDSFCPELAALKGIRQNEKFHKEGDVWTHTMMVVDAAAERKNKVTFPLYFMTAALCHDFGKAVCTTEVNGVVHSYKHELESIRLSKRFLDSVGAKKEMKDYVANMVEYHMQPNILASVRSKIKNTNKLFYLSSAPSDLIQLSVCDCIGKLPYEGDNEQFLTERLHIFYEIMDRPFVTAEDLLNSGIPEDEYFPRILEHAHKLRLAGIKKDNALKQAVSFARKIKG